MNNMKKVKISTFLIMVSISIGLCTNTIVKTPAQPVKNNQSAEKISNVVYEPVNSLDVVAHPSKYLNKHVKIKAKFDKYSTLGLDYKPAFRSSEKYITVLIKRDDVTNHTIPLSEMKIFLKREEAEKYVDLSSGDEIEFQGYVFSNALGDIWIEVEKFTVLSQKTKTDKSPKK